MVHQASDTPSPAPRPDRNTPPPTGAPQAEQIKIGFNDSNGSGLEFKLKTSTKLGKAMNAFSAHMQRDIKQLRFLFEGHRLQPDDTPQSVSERGSASSTDGLLTPAYSWRWRMVTRSKSTWSRSAAVRLRKQHIQKLTPTIAEHKTLTTRANAAYSNEQRLCLPHVA